MTLEIILFLVLVDIDKPGYTYLHWYPERECWARARQLNDGLPHVVGRPEKRWYACLI